jgi:hypothetical protein
MTKRFDLIVFEKFSYRGQTRHKAHRVGSATASKTGFMLFIPPGVSITGRVMMVPEKTALNEIDLIEAYQSAADEHGL